MREGEQAEKRYFLIGPDGQSYPSPVPGTLGGHRKLRIYGRLDCPSALRWLQKGHYAGQRVFFASEEHARAAGFRPCAVCLAQAYETWKEAERKSGVPGPSRPRSRR